MHPTYLKIPSDIYSLIAHNLNYRKMIICWFWQAVLSSRSYHRLRWKSHRLKSWLVWRVEWASSSPILQTDPFHTENATWRLLGLKSMPSQVICEQEHSGAHTLLTSKCLAYSKAQSLTKCPSILLWVAELHLGPSIPSISEAGRVMSHGGNHSRSSVIEPPGGRESCLLATSARGTWRELCFDSLVCFLSYLKSILISAVTEEGEDGINCQGKSLKWKNGISLTTIFKA